jgi:putative FmdB family regulatory protein
MPTYEYECERCGHHFEVFQSMKDAKLTDCPLPECEGPVRRLLGTGAGLIFKGSGFYETDYRSESYKQGAKKAEEQAKSSSGDGGGTAAPKESTTPAPAAAPASTPTAAPAKSS